MERENLYKAIRKDNSQGFGEWAFGDLYHERDFHGKVINVIIVEHRKDLCLVSGAPDNNQWWVDVIPGTDCQFITEINGQRIFEGDIVTHPRCKKGVVQWLSDRGGFFVVFDGINTDIIQRDPIFKSAWKMNAFKWEVIGNIHSKN